MSRQANRVFTGMLAALCLAAGAARGAIAPCGPFMDVGGPAPSCPFILEVYRAGLTAGTSPSTFGPTQPVTRQVLAAWMARSLSTHRPKDSRRAALDRFWTAANIETVGLTTVGAGARLCKSDGADIWVAGSEGTVSRVRASDGKLLDTWTGAPGAFGVLSAMGQIFVTASTSPGALYRIDPSQPAGDVEMVAALPNTSRGIAFDGTRIWVANVNSVSIVTPGSWEVITLSAGFVLPTGILYDGAHVWVTDAFGRLLELDGNGAVVKSVSVGANPRFPVFDGAHIWVPTQDGVAVVSAETGEVVATLGTEVDGATAAAFDGDRVMITNTFADSVQLWRAADLAPLGSFAAGVQPFGACSDGVDLWFTRADDSLARF